MELYEIIAIIVGATGALLGIIVQITMRLERARAKIRELSMRTDMIIEKAPEETSAKLEAIANRLELLERSIGVEPIAEERVQSIDNRLADMEKALEPFTKRRPEATSIEYNFLMFEIDRLVRDLKEDIRRQNEELARRQSTYEVNLDHRMGTFRTIFTVSLTVVGIIIAGFGALIWFIGQV